MRKRHLLKDDQVSIFCSQLYMAINAGIPAYQGISILIDDTEDKETKQLLEQIFGPMQLGGSLHEALEKTGVFPSYMVRMVQLGEETGKLEDVLQSLTLYYEREAQIKESIRYAVTYPAFMFVLMISVILILMTKALPVFVQIYEQLGSELTGSAYLLMQTSLFLNRYLMMIIVALAVIILAGYILYRSKAGSRMLGKSRVAMKIGISRFANCMYLAVSSGQDSDKGLELADQLVEAPKIKQRIKKCRELMTQGEAFSEAVFKAELFPKMYASWLSIAYTTGNIDEMMKKICDAYEEETDRSIQHFISSLEPVLVIILSIFVGLILVSFILPLLGIMTSIG